MKEVVIGFDIGGTYTKYGFVTRDGEIRNEGSVPTVRNSNVPGFINDLKKAVDSENKEGYIIRGIGIGAPNGNYYRGTVEYAPNLKWKGVIPLKQYFEDSFGVTASVTNDANAAAFGEMLYGNAKGLKDFIMITLGTGLGSGIVANGEMIYGHDGFAGELGHINAIPEGRKCGCGRKGCLETYASATGIVRTVFELMASENIETELSCFGKLELEAKHISVAAHNGDKIALMAYDQTANILGLKLADAVATTSPEAIFIFGGLAAAGDLIMKPLEKYLNEYLLPIYKNKVKLLPSALQDKNIAVMGAAALKWKELD